MTDADLLRKRRQAAALDADPLVVFQAERDRLQAQIEELQARIAIDRDLHGSKVADLDQSIATQQKVIGQLRQDLEAEKRHRGENKARTERAFQHIRDILRNEPEARDPTLHDIQAIAVMAFQRVVAERDMAMAQAGTFQALMARIGQFLATCAQTMDAVDDLGSMRAEANTLHTETVKAQAAAPFIHSMVKAVQAADRLVKALDQGGMPNAARAPLDQLRRELADVPEPVRGLQPAMNVAGKTKKVFANALKSVERSGSGKLTYQDLIVADDISKWTGFTSIGSYIAAEKELIAKVDNLVPVVVTSTTKNMIDPLILRDDVMDRITRPPEITWVPVTESNRASMLTITAVDGIGMWVKGEYPDQYIRDKIDAGNYPEISFMVIREAEGQLFWAGEQKAYITQMEREFDGTVRFFAGYEGAIYQRQPNGMIVKLRDPFDVPVMGSAEFDKVNSQPYIDYGRLLPDAADEAIRGKIDRLGAANVRFLIKRRDDGKVESVVSSIARVVGNPGGFRFYYDLSGGMFRRNVDGSVLYFASTDPPF